MIKKTRPFRLGVIEDKISRVRGRWVDSTSQSETLMCERYVNSMLERWQYVSDEIKFNEITKGVKIKWSS